MRGWRERSRGGVGGSLEWKTSVSERCRAECVNSLSTAVTDRLTDDVGQESARTMFGDDTSTYRQSGEQVVEVLKRWRKAGNDPGSWRGEGSPQQDDTRGEASGAGRQVREESREEWKRGEETCLMHFLFVCFLADVSKSSQNLAKLPDEDAIGRSSS